MIFKRKIYTKLKEWKENSNGSLILYIQKTYKLQMI